MVVGGGNSAGQAAVFLAGQVRKVYLVVRGDNLYKDMSSYLAERVEQTANIEVLFNTEVRRLSGDRHLGEVELVNNNTAEVRRLKTAALFSFIGAVPRTNWLPAEIETDQHGFIRTGPCLSNRRPGAEVASRSCSKPAGRACSRPGTWRRLDQAGGLGRWRRGDGRPVRS